MIANEINPIIMVDDNEGDLYIAERYYEKSKLSNPFMLMRDGPSLLDYLISVEAGREPMPVLVLLDINMPGMDGFEVLSEVRSRRTFSDMPVIMMLTNSDNPRDVERSEELGADGFQTKPMRMEDYLTFFNELAGGEAAV
jgi:CheY-like chemotaxis protein